MAKRKRDFLHLHLNQLTHQDLMFLPNPHGEPFAPNLHVDGKDVIVHFYDVALPQAQEIVNTWLQGKSWHGNTPKSVNVLVESIK